MDEAALLETKRRIEAGDSEARLALASHYDRTGDPGEARRVLEQGVTDDDVRAMTALGQMFLVRPGMPVADGIRLIIEAAQKGEAEAAHQVAVFAAAGAGIPQDWTLAFDFLLRAAELGHGRARAQLVIFAGVQDAVDGAESALGSAVWKRLRDSVDVGKWLAPTTQQVALERPRVWIVENFLPPRVCNWLMDCARPKMEPARVYDRNTAGAAADRRRTNSFTDFNIVETDLVMCVVRQRIASATNLALAGMEHTAVLHYDVGQQFAPHFDFLDPDIPAYAQDAAQRGQRVLTFLAYLNENYQGGETEFPKTNWRYKGRTGDALFFFNVDHDGQPDRRSLHAGLPPTSGEKWLLSQFIRKPVAAVSS